MGKNIIPLLSFIAIVFMESCAPTKATFNSTLSPNITSEKISSIAIIPFTGIKADKADLGKIDTTAINALDKKKIKIKVTGSYAVNKLLPDSLARELSNYSNNYGKNEVEDSRFISKIGKELKSDAIIFGNVSNIIQNNAVYGDKFGDTKITLKIYMYSSTTGKLLWKAESQGTVGTLTTNDPAPPVIEAVFAAVKEIFMNFPLK